jgi:hypothetical protein
MSDATMDVGDQHMPTLAGPDRAAVPRRWHPSQGGAPWGRESSPTDPPAATVPLDLNGFDLNGFDLNDFDMNGFDLNGFDQYPSPPVVFLPDCGCPACRQTPGRGSGR